MNGSDITTYIRTQQAAGHTDEAIIGRLIEAGWDHTTLHQVLLDVLRDSPAVAAQEAVITVRDLTKYYRDTHAVDGVSFDVHRGETFGILGPNGAGKTTTLEIIEGLKRPTSGSIFVDGLDVTKHTHAVKAIIGVQLQASSFFEGLTLVELLDTFAAMYGRTVDALGLLDMVQLTEKAKSQVKELSGGQKQRFSIAVGLVNAPIVLFLDEPTTGLDPQARHNLWGLVEQIKQNGTTIVLTTHYMEEAERLCDRIAIMDNGRIVALDTTRNLLNSLDHASVVAFASRADLPAALLEDIPGVSGVQVELDSYALTTAVPQQTLAALFARSREHGFSIDSLALKQTTLEDVFLKLTGHHLRD